VSPYGVEDHRLRGIGVEFPRAGLIAREEGGRCGEIEVIAHEGCGTLLEQRQIGWVDLKLFDDARALAATEDILRNARGIELRDIGGIGLSSPNVDGVAPEESTEGGIGGCVEEEVGEDLFGMRRDTRQIAHGHACFGIAAAAERREVADGAVVADV